MFTRPTAPACVEETRLTEFRNNIGGDRYELIVEGGTAFVDYRDDGAVLTLLHTEVPDALSGRRVGSALVRSVLDDARARGRRVVSRCSFVDAFIARHPDYTDLLG